MSLTTLRVIIKLVITNNHSTRKKYEDTRHETLDRIIKNK